MGNIKVLCIHGIGGKDAEMNDSYGWVKDWRDEFVKMGVTDTDNVSFMEFDTHFNGYNADLSDYWDFFKITFQKKIKEERFIKEWFDYHPDMVVEFLLDKNNVRENLRKELKNKIEKENPDIIYAHSLGGMMCYDFFTQPENDKYNNIILVTAGTQLGNPRLKNHKLKQPVEMLPVKFWYNLNNPKDKVFARFPINPLNQNGCYKEKSNRFYKSLGHDGLWYIKKAEKSFWDEVKNYYLSNKT